MYFGPSNLWTGERLQGSRVSPQTKSVCVAGKCFPVSDSKSLECNLTDPEQISPPFIRQQLRVTYS